MRVHGRDAVALIVGNENVTNNFVIGYVFPFVGDDAATRDAIQSWLSERADAMPFLRDRIIRVPFDLGLPVYTPDEHFSYERHIRFSDVSSWDELRVTVPAMVQELMNPAHPLWEITVAPRVDGVLDSAAPSTVVLLKFHHSFADGGESIAVARALFAETVPAPSAAVQMRRPPSRLALLADAAWRLPFVLASFFWSLRHVVTGKRAFSRDVANGNIVTQKFERSSVPFVGRLGPSRTLECVTMSVAEMKAVKNAVGDVSINDIVLTVVSLGLSRYMERKGIVVPHSLGTSMPISIRHLQPEATSRNQFVTSMVVLHTDVVDPVERLRRIHESARASIDAGLNPSTRLIARTLDDVPGSVMRLTIPLLNRLQKPDGAYPIHTSVSSLAMGPDGWRLGEASATASFGAMSLEALVGVAHMINTLADTATINIVSDPDLFPDASLYRKFVDEAWRDVNAAARSRSV